MRTGGHAAFAVKFDFNRKRNIVEIEIKQDDTEGNGRTQYTGPLSVVVQEVDGAFTHTIQIDGAVSHAEISCHSKGRKQRKKKVPLLTGEEIEIDLTNMDAESPILWLRIDPDYLLIREITISQPMFHWEYMLRYERDVIAQMEALERIQALPSAHSRSVIVDAVANEKFFYRYGWKNRKKNLDFHRFLRKFASKNEFKLFSRFRLQNGRGLLGSAHKRGVC